MSLRTETTSLATVFRQLPYLAPEDSVQRALDFLRNGPDTLPIVDPWGRLRGVLTLADLKPLMESGQADALDSPVVQHARRPSHAGHASLSVEEARRLLIESGETTLFILDDDNRYLGAVRMVDLLAPYLVPARPAHIGGMATPAGVYLTSGDIQAGASNLALVAGGALLGVLLALAHGSVGMLAWAAQHGAGMPLYSLWSAPQPAHLHLENIGWFLMQGLSLPIFLLLLRLLPLAGYHAAEHQAVHAMERGEPLHPEVVKRMPRVHPRCGTNLMAGGLIFAAVSQAVPALRIGGLDSADGTILGAIAAIFSWRTLGAFLQQHFTTRRANDPQIASGIAAAIELEHKYQNTIPRRPAFWRRLWCMGLPQTFIGVTLGSTPLFYLFDWIFHYLK